MKKLFSTVLAIIGFSLLMAQSADVPTAIKTAFNTKHKGVSAKWTAGSQNYIVNWEENGKKMTAYYTKDEQSSIIRTETEVAMSELSTNAQDNIKTRFLTEGSTYTLVRTFKVEGFENGLEGCELSNANGNKISVFFDANGNLSRREKSN